MRFGGGANCLQSPCPSVVRHVPECLNREQLDALLLLSAASASPRVFGLTMHPLPVRTSPFRGALERGKRESG